MSKVSFEPVEPRRLFASVTLVTHGYESGDDRPGWLDSAKDAIVALAGSGTAVYDLRVVEDGDDVKVDSFTHLSGPGFTDAAGNGDAVVMLDWADASGVLSYHPTADIAALVKPYFVNAYPDLGIASPLADVPIHLIGHSRGASLVSALAMDLGRNGVEVDQLTTLDPHPVSKDAAVKAYANARFADNDWQSGGLLTFGGAKVDGAHNLKLDDDVLSDGGYDFGDGGTHSDVHLWYQGTIDTSSSSNEEGVDVPSGYYPSPQGPRAQVGFAYSDLAAQLGLGVARPSDGIGTSFGGSATRSTLTPGSAMQWANVSNLRLTTPAPSAVAGDALSAQFDLWDNDSSADQVTLYLDADTDPFNAGAVYQVTASDPYATSGTVGHPTDDVPLYTQAVPAGTYRLLAVITDGEHTKYAYDATALTLTAAPTPGTPALDPGPTRAVSPNSGPDLTVAFATPVPASVLPGKPATAKLTLRNQGNLPGKGKVTVNVYASSDDVLDDADKLLGTRTVSLNLAANKASGVSVSLVDPAGIAKGDYHLVAQVVPGALAEKDASNDAAVASATTSISPPIVDLAGAFSKIPFTVSKNKATAIITVTNAGNVTAKGRLSLDVLNHFDGTNVGSLLRSVSLGAGKSMTLKVPLSIFPVTGLLDGTLAFAGTLPDTDLSNNAFTSPITG